MERLIIQHIDGSHPPQFQVVRMRDGKATVPVVAPSPDEFPVEGRGQSCLIAELRWYLEDFLNYPYPPLTGRAEKVQDALRQWGTEIFNVLFSNRSGARFYDAATRRGHENLCLQISSDGPSVLAWPWEALYDPETGFLAQTCQVERRLNRIRDPMTLSEKLPKDRVNILLVTARPYTSDVHYRSMSRPLVELIEKKNLPASVHVLRPPTFDRLREHLREKPSFYHILHFDGHGAYGTDSLSNSKRFTLRGALGHLIFEEDDGSPSSVTAEQLGPLLLECALPCVVLNACQSAMVGKSAENPFASVAAALLRAGVRSVVAMAYSLYVSGAQEFLPAFYLRLFETGDPAQAMRAGRQQMFARQDRVCARGRFRLQDWLVPVLYQQDALDLSFAVTSQSETSLRESKLPLQANDEMNPYCIIGRDAAMLALERAMRRRSPAVLIHGLGGVGKTTLVRGFLQWLETTHGLGNGAFWFGFQDIRSAEYIFNRMGEDLFGAKFRLVDLEGKISALTSHFKRHRFYIVWDNFEVVRGMAGTKVQPNLPEKEQALLFAFLKGLRDGETKVLITSRSEEEWLGIERGKLLLGGLEHEERWEFCNVILADLGIKVNRDDETLVELMDYLHGHPLAMRVILPKLEKLTATQILSSLKFNLEGIGPGWDEAQSRFFAVLRFVGESIPGDLAPLLIPLTFHEQYLDAKLLESICRRVGDRWTQEHVVSFLHLLVVAGLLHDCGHAVFEMHPALNGFLYPFILNSVSTETRNIWARAFVSIMSGLADSLANKELYEQHPCFHHMKANLYNAMHEAKQLSMYMDLAVLLKTLGVYARNTRSYREAKELFAELVNVEKSLENPKGEARAYHHLGRVAQRERDFDSAENWYLKSLEIKERANDEEGAAISYHQLGIVAEERRDFETAREWHLKSLEIKERRGDERGAAKSYHQLGFIAGKQKDIKLAEELYLKSLVIDERHCQEHGVAISYHQLGCVAKAQGDFEKAREWYLKSLEIKERHGNELGAAITYQQMGNVAQQQGDLDTARKWYLKSLEIKERHGNERGAAITYRGMGKISQAERDFDTAESWYLKSLKISERHSHQYGVALAHQQLAKIACERRDFEIAQDWNLKSLEIMDEYGDEHAAADICCQLGVLEALSGNHVGSGRWLTNSIARFSRTKDDQAKDEAFNAFLECYRKACDGDRLKLKDIWTEAGLGTFPEGLEE